jgi:hypothetical protein
MLPAMPQIKSKDDSDWTSAFTQLRYLTSPSEEQHNWEIDLEEERSYAMLWGEDRIPGLRIFEDPMDNANSVAQGLTNYWWRNNSPVENWHASSGLDALSDADMMRHNAATARVCLLQFQNFFVNKEPIDWAGLCQIVGDLNRAFPNGKTPGELATKNEAENWQNVWVNREETLSYVQDQLGDLANVLIFLLPNHGLSQQPGHWPHPLFPRCVGEVLVNHANTPSGEFLETIKEKFIQGPDLLTDEQAEEFIAKFPLGVTPGMDSGVKEYFWG